MIGVAQDDLRAELFQGFIAQALDSRLRPYRHKHRSFDWSVRCCQTSAARSGGVCFRYFKRKIHPSSVSGEIWRLGSGERPRQAGEEDHERERNADRDSQRFPEWQLFRIGGRKTYGNEDERPYPEQIKKSE